MAPSGLLGADQPRAVGCDTDLERDVCGEAEAPGFVWWGSRGKLQQRSC